jgi:hypothetical protein
MGLPMDFSTALWWRSVPVWEWEALPALPDAAASAGSDSADCAAGAAPSAWPEGPSVPAPRPGAEREGFHLVFRGYEVSASLFWYPSDSPLSRPWLRHDDAAHDRRPRAAQDDDPAARAWLQAERDPGTEAP